MAWVVAVSSINAFVLQAPPYNFSHGINALINIPATIGQAAGGVLGGYLTNVYARWRARRNDGIFEPEYRLPSLVLPAISGLIGCLMFGYGVQQSMSWPVLFVGYGFINIGLTGVGNIGMTYVMDSYHPVAADALLVVNGLKNVFAFGFTYSAVPWITASGYRDAFGAIGGIYVGAIALALPLYWVVPSIRRYTGSKWPLIWV